MFSQQVTLAFLDDKNRLKFSHLVSSETINTSIDIVIAGRAFGNFYTCSIDNKILTANTAPTFAFENNAGDSLIDNFTLSMDTCSGNLSGNTNTINVSGTVANDVAPGTSLTKSFTFSVDYAPRSDLNGTLGIYTP